MLDLLRGLPIAQIATFGAILMTLIITFMLIKMVNQVDF